VLREFVEPESTVGQVVCPVCGTANPAGRAFCRHCGSPLAPAVAAEKEKRRFRWRWPKGRGRWRRWLAALIVLVLLALAAWAAVQYGPRAVDAVRDKLAKPVLTTPSEVTASSAAPGHPARLVTDGLSNRFWAPTKGKGAGQWVELSFDQPVRVLEMIVTGGVSPEQDLYLGEGRPADLLVSMWTPEGVRTDKRLHLADHAGPQNFSMAIGGVTKIRVTVESGYDLAQGRVPAIGEIEVFKRP